MTAVDWLVTFDVTSDGARRRLVRDLERLGPRVAYSVFTIRISAARLDRLLVHWAGLVGPDGHLLALPYCAACEVAIAGLDLEVVPEPGWVSW